MTPAILWQLRAKAADVRDTVRANWDDLKRLGMTEAEVHDAFHGADRAVVAFDNADYRRATATAKEG